MSIILIAETYRRQFSRPQQAVLLAMCDEVRKGMTTCWPSAATVAWKSGYSERHVRRVWSQLEALGVLTRAGVSRLGTIRWRVDPSQAPAKPGRELRSEPASDSIVSDPEETETRTLTLPASDIPAPDPGHQMADKPRTPKPRIHEPEHDDRERREGRHHLEAPSPTLSELRETERVAVTDMGVAEDRLRLAQRCGDRREVRRCQLAYDAASRRFLVIQRERLAVESGQVRAGNGAPLPRGAAVPVAVMR